MARIDSSLCRSIHHATGMSNDDIARDQAEYIHRFVEAGLAIIAVRQRMAGDAPAPTKKAPA